MLSIPLDGKFNTLNSPPAVFDSTILKSSDVSLPSVDSSYRTQSLSPLCAGTRQLAWPIATSPDRICFLHHTSPTASSSQDVHTAIRPQATVDYPVKVAIAALAVDAVDDFLLALGA